MFGKVKRFITKSKKVLGYLPLLINDEDGDVDFLLVLMNHKLKEMYIEFAECDMPEEQEQVEQCITHIDELLFLNADDNFESRIGLTDKEVKASMLKQMSSRKEHWECIWDTIKFYGNGWVS